MWGRNDGIAQVNVPLETELCSIFVFLVAPRGKRSCVVDLLLQRWFTQALTLTLQRGCSFSTQGSRVTRDATNPIYISKASCTKHPHPHPTPPPHKHACSCITLTRTLLNYSLLISSYKLKKLLIYCQNWIFYFFKYPFSDFPTSWLKMADHFDGVFQVAICSHLDTLQWLCQLGVSHKVAWWM